MRDLTRSGKGCPSPRLVEVATPGELVVIVGCHPDSRFKALSAKRMTGSEDVFFVLADDVKGGRAIFDRVHEESRRDRAQLQDPQR